MRLGFPVEATDAGSATLGLSELGTNMARGMIKETKPTRFYDLVQLMGLSHGTDVWTGNAQELIRNGTCDLNSVIGCRDSIMTSLIYWGLPNKDAFDIMEGVRKGKVAAGKVEKWPEYVKEMKDPAACLTGTSNRARRSSTCSRRHMLPHMRSRP